MALDLPHEAREHQHVDVMAGTVRAQQRDADLQYSLTQLHPVVNAVRRETREVFTVTTSMGALTGVTWNEYRFTLGIPES
jgi:hypothetical protein